MFSAAYSAARPPPPLETVLSISAGPFDLSFPSLRIKSSHNTAASVNIHRITKRHIISLLGNEAGRSRCCD